MRNLPVLPALFVLLLIASPGFSKTGFLSLERKDGKTVEAEVLLFEDDQVRIRNRSGRVFTIPIDQLSGKTRESIKTHFETTGENSEETYKVPPNVERMEALLRSIRDTRYQHKIDIRESEGIVYADCSSLTRFVLEDVAPKHLAEIREHQGGALSKNFFHFFNELDEKGTRLWKRIDNFEDVQPGDLIVWASNGLTERGTTGHVMTAMSRPKRDSRNKYSITIADSARSAHADDTRAKMESPQGVGSGTMWFGTDDDGKPVQWWWSNPDFRPSPEDPSTILGIAVGRPL